jgi:hypothetical protein
VTDSAVERDVGAEEAALDGSEETLMARIAGDRRAGVTLLETCRHSRSSLARRTNKAALDRLAK